MSPPTGGLGTGHGGASLEEIEIPFILYGRGVKRGYTIPHPVCTYDNAATAAFALGLTPPSAWIGRPVRSAFEGFPDPPAETAALPLPAPTIFPDRQAYVPPGGLFIDTIPEVRMQSTEASAVIRYTLDGAEPGPDAPVYEAPFTLDRSTVVKARAFTPDRASRARSSRPPGSHRCRWTARSVASSSRKRSKHGGYAVGVRVHEGNRDRGLARHHPPGYTVNYVVHGDHRTCGVGARGGRASAL